MNDDLTPEIIGRRARRAVDKIDAQGLRGATLLSLQEIEALAMIAALSGLLAPRAGAESVTETPMFKTRRKP